MSFVYCLFDLRALSLGTLPESFWHPWAPSWHPCIPPQAAERKETDVERILGALWAACRSLRGIKICNGFGRFFLYRRLGRHLGDLGRHRVSKGLPAETILGCFGGAGENVNEWFVSGSIALRVEGPERCLGQHCVCNVFPSFLGTTFKLVFFPPLPDGEVLVFD